MSFLNPYQEAHVADLARIKPENKCYCGWYNLGECPSCPPSKTCADKMKARCKYCGNSPPPEGGEITHIINCRMARKSDQRRPATTDAESDD